MKRILIIEDDPEIRDLLQLALESFSDVEIKLCRSGLQGIATARACSPDLIIVDYYLGDSLATQVMARVPRGTKFILISGLLEGDPPTGTRYLQKPFSLDDIQMAVREELGMGGGNSPQ